MIQERIDKRFIFISGSGMNDHAAGLVDKNNVSILIKNLKRYILRNNTDGFCFRNSQHQFHSGFCFSGGLDFRNTIDNQLTFLHQRHDARAGKRRLFTQISIQTHAGFFLLNNQFDGFFIHDVPPAYPPCGQNKSKQTIRLLKR